MKKKKHVFLLLVVGAISILSCSQKSKDECAKHIGQTIHQGDSIAEAQSKLKDCGFKTSLDRKNFTLYGDKRTEQTPPVFERTQVVIRFDSDDRVTDVQVGGGLIGP